MHSEDDGVFYGALLWHRYGLLCLGGINFWRDVRKHYGPLSGIDEPI